MVVIRFYLFFRWLTLPCAVYSPTAPRQCSGRPVLDHPYVTVVQVPWKTFATRPSKLHVSGVTLVLEPLGNANYDDAVEQELRDAVFAKKQV